MKRRKFLGYTLGAFSLPVLAGNGRLYGAPQSIIGSQPQVNRDRLKLDLSRATVPPELWELLSRYGSFWEEVLHDVAMARQFAKRPKQFLAHHGLGSPLADGEIELKLLQLMADRDVRDLAANGSYQDFIQVLASHGILSQAGSSPLQQEITRILSRDLDSLRSAFARITGDLDEDTLLAALDSEPFTRIAMAVAGSGDSGVQSVIAAAAVVVVIAAAVVIYVTVGVGVLVSITLGFSITAAVTVAVTVGGPCEPECHRPDAVPGGAVELEAGNAISRPRELAAMLAQVGQLDPAGQEDFRRIARAATLLGNSRFPRTALRRLLADEVDAVFGACRSLGLLTLRAETFNLIVASAKELAYRAVGVAGFAPEGRTGAGPASPALPM